METLDIYASPPPNRSTENGSASLTSRLVWCGIQYMGRQLFYAHELGLLIEDIYGEKCWESQEYCYSCEIHFKMNPLISKLKLYDFEVRDL